jgi:hypothetical protein
MGAEDHAPRGISDTDRAACRAANRDASERRAVLRSDLTSCARDAGQEKVFVRAAAVDYLEWSVDNLWSD